MATGHAPRMFRCSPDVLPASIGNAGEAVVKAHLLSRGYNASKWDDNDLPFDLLLYLGPPGHEFVRVQVKTCVSTTRGGCMYSVTRGGGREYDPGSYDLLALVCLHPQNIAFFAATETDKSMYLRPHRRAGKVWYTRDQGRLFSAFPLDRALMQVARLRDPLSGPGSDATPSAAGATSPQTVPTESAPAEQPQPARTPARGPRIPSRPAIPCPPARSDVLRSRGSTRGERA